MKKFTITLLTAVIFTVSAMFGCLTVSAEETEMTMSISMEEYKELVDNPIIAADIAIEDDSKTYSFYSQLDDNNKSAYDKMEAAWLEPNVEPIIFTLTDKVSFEADSSSLSDWTEEQQSEFWALVFSTFQTGEVAFEFDYPGIFWYDKDLMQVSINTSSSYSFRKGTYTITVNKVQLTPGIKEVFGDAETALEAQNCLAEKIEAFEIEGDDFYTKLKYIHDYVANAVTYNINAPYCDTAYGIFVEPNQIVCEGYSEMFMLLCKREGIPCIGVVGNVIIETNMAHMWNYVMMEDGNWYAIDLTWDDLDSEETPVKYQYFLKGSESFLPTHTPDNEYITPGFVYPELSTTDYVYGTDEPAVTTAVVTTTSDTTTKLTTLKNTSTASETTLMQITSESTNSVTASKASTTTTTTVFSSISCTETTVAITTETSTTSEVALTTTSVTTFVSSNTTTAVTEAISTETQPSQPEIEIIKGDFNRNGYLDIADVVLLQKKLICTVSIDNTDFDYDLNNDDKLNVWDLVILIKTIKI